MTIAQTVTTGQTVLIPDMGEIAQLRAELAATQARAERAERELMATQAMLKPAAQTAKQLAELRKIFRGNDWGPTERGTLAAMLFHGWEQSQTTDHWLKVCEGGAAKLAELTNTHRNTANNLINRLEAVGIVDRVESNTAVNRYGEPIPPRKVDTTNGDRWQNSSVIAITATLPGVLPPLATETKQTKHNRANASELRKLARMAADALKLPCPHCGTVGELHIVCKSCGVVNTADELAKMADEADYQSQAGGAIMAETTPATMTTEQKRKANGRRRMREVKGVASTPAPGITYEFDEASDISISLPGAVAHTMCNGVGQIDHNNQNGGAIAHSMCNGVALHKNCATSLYGCTIFVQGMEGTEGGNDGPDADWSVILGGWGQ